MRIAKLKKELQKPENLSEINTCLKSLAIAKSCQIPRREVLVYYYDALRDYPIELVDYACKEYVKNCVYQKFPQIAELIQYIEPELKEKRIELTFYQNVLKDREKPNVRYDNPKYNKDTSSHIKNVLPSINKGT